MRQLVTIANEERYQRQISRLVKENDRLKFTLQVLVRNFEGFCCLCDHDPEKNEEPCPVKEHGTLLDCVAWLVDGANRQRDT